MISKIPQKEKAIALRKAGKTYSEILAVVPIAKSTLSDWLYDVGLLKKQKQRITAKRIAGQKRGAEARRNQRIQKTTEIFVKAKETLGQITKRDLWILGIALYWAEGTKERENSIGRGLAFSNSDPRMIQIFLSWLFDVFQVERDRIWFELFIHETHKHRLQEIQNKWSMITGFSIENFNHVYYKKNKIKTKRKNTGSLYYGQLQVKVKASSTLNRTISGWVHGICEHCGIV